MYTQVWARTKNPSPLQNYQAEAIQGTVYSCTCTVTGTAKGENPHPPLRMHKLRVLVSAGGAIHVAVLVLSVAGWHGDSEGTNAYWSRNEDFTETLQKRNCMVSVSIFFPVYRTSSETKDDGRAERRTQQ